MTIIDEYDVLLDLLGYKNPTLKVTYDIFIDFIIDLNP